MSPVTPQPRPDRRPRAHGRRGRERADLRRTSPRGRHAGDRPRHAGAAPRRCGAWAGWRFGCAGSAARSRPRSRARSTTTCGPSWCRPRTRARRRPRRGMRPPRPWVPGGDEFGTDPDADRREAYSFEPWTRRSRWGTITPCRARSPRLRRGPGSRPRDGGGSRGRRPGRGQSARRDALPPRLQHVASRSTGSGSPRAQWRRSAEAVAITPDVGALDPMSPNGGEIDGMRALLDDLGLVATSRPARVSCSTRAAPAEPDGRAGGRQGRRVDSPATSHGGTSTRASCRSGPTPRLRGSAGPSTSSRYPSAIASRRGWRPS